MIDWYECGDCGGKVWAGLVCPCQDDPDREPLEDECEST